MVWVKSPKESLAQEVLRVEVQLEGMWRSAQTADIHMQAASLVHWFEATTTQQYKPTSFEHNSFVFWDMLKMTWVEIGVDYEASTTQCMQLCYRRY